MILNSPRWADDVIKNGRRNIMKTRGTSNINDIYRADSRLAPSQWETALFCNDVSHWLGANLESALCLFHILDSPVTGRGRVMTSYLAYSRSFTLEGWSFLSFLSSPLAAPRLRCLRSILKCTWKALRNIRFVSLFSNRKGYQLMTSSNGNIFRVTGPLCEEFTGHRWIFLTTACDA